MQTLNRTNRVYFIKSQSSHSERSNLKFPPSPSSVSSEDLDISHFLVQEWFDLEPKTDYTYSKSKSYNSVRCDTSCRSPNMSRRGLHGSDLSGYRDSPGRTPSCTHWLRSREIFSNTSSPSQDSNISYSSYLSESFQAEQVDSNIDYNIQNQQQQQWRTEELEESEIVEQRMLEEQRNLEEQRRLVEQQRLEEQRKEKEEKELRQSYLFNVRSLGKESAKKSRSNTKTVMTVKNTVTEIFDKDSDRYVEKGIKEANLSKGVTRKEAAFGSGDFTNETVTTNVTSKEYDYMDSGDNSVGSRSSGYFSDRKRNSSTVTKTRQYGSTEDNDNDDLSENSEGRFSFLTNILTSSTCYVTSKISAATAAVISGAASVGGIFKKEKATNIQHMYGLDSDSELDYNNDADRHVTKSRDFHYTKDKNLRRFQGSGELLRENQNQKSNQNIITKCVTTVVEWFVPAEISTGTSNESKSKSRRWLCCCCLPLFLLLLLPLLLTSLWPVAGVAEKNSTNNIINHYFFLPFFSTDKSQKDTTPSVPLTTSNSVLEGRISELMLQLQMTQNKQQSQLTKADVELIVKELLSGKIADLSDEIRDQKLKTTAEMEQLQIHQAKTMDERIAPLVAEAKAIGLELLALKSGIESHEGKNEESKAKMSKLNTILNNVVLELGQLQDFQSSYLNLFKNCCKNATAFQSAVREEVYAALVKSIGNDKDESMSGSSNYQILTAWLHNNYISRSELESQLSGLTATLTAKLNDMLAKERVNKTLYVGEVGSGITASFVRSLVDEALMKFSADKTGLADYALESGGGSVISSRCSETFAKKTALVSMFGIPLFYKSNSPRTAIQPDVNPGECWAFKGTSGVLVIQLSRLIRITAFSMEHIPKSLAPYGQIDSAPKDFSVYSLNDINDSDSIHLGNYTYKEDGGALQQFPVQVQDAAPTQLVEVRINSNHGNMEFTCLYRFRIHGVPEN
ncbi:uncharacterized protein LOC115212367 isoform X1 [Argonauta hians]